MKYKRLKPAKDGEWIQPQMRGYLMGCCDCGLVHRLNFRVAKTVKNGKTVVDHVQFQAERAPRYTAMIRKKDRIVLRKP